LSEHWANEPEALKENDWAVWLGEFDNWHEDDPGRVTCRIEDPPYISKGQRRLRSVTYQFHHRSHQTYRPHMAYLRQTDAGSDLSTGSSQSIDADSLDIYPIYRSMQSQGYRTP
jgi:hypothetical protein